MEHSKVSYCGLTSIADAFDEYFKLAHDPLVDRDAFETYQTIGQEAIYIDLITRDQIIVTAKKLSNKITPSSDGIPSFVESDCIYALSHPLNHIFNLILSKTFNAPYSYFLC